MLHLVLVVTLLTGFFTTYQSQKACGIPTDLPAPIINWDLSQPTQAEALAAQILDYLNRVNSADSLPESLANEELDAAIFNSDFTGDGVSDIAIQLVIRHPDDFYYEHALLLYSCQAGVYEHLDTFSETLLMDFMTDEAPVALEFSVDLNNNQRRDLMIRRYVLHEDLDGDPNGIFRIFQELVLFEWDGSGWAKILTVGPAYEGYNLIEAINLDDDPFTLELTIGSWFYYESGAAQSYTNYHYFRDTTAEYRWNGAQYELVCRYFTDEGDSALHILHNAEAFRACGWYELAWREYDQITAPLFSDAEFLPWTNSESPPPLAYPEGMSEEEQYPYAAQVESAYYLSFASYRLLQLELVAAEDAGAVAARIDNTLNNRLRNYNPGDQGYVYKAMAQALGENYQTTGDLQQACEAAAAAYEAAIPSGTDPGIAYVMSEGASAEMPFYHGDHLYPFTYGANPDNFFAVPADIAPMISTPVCLE